MHFKQNKCPFLQYLGSFKMFLQIVHFVLSGGEMNQLTGKPELTVSGSALRTSNDDILSCKHSTTALNTLNCGFSH
jgi:hypothetical protein